MSNYYFSLKYIKKITLLAFFLSLIQTYTYAYEEPEPYYMLNYAIEHSQYAYFDNYTTRSINVCYANSSIDLGISNIPYVDYVYGWYEGNPHELISNCVNNNLNITQFLERPSFKYYKNITDLKESEPVTVFFCDDQGNQYYLTMNILVYFQLTYSINSTYQSILFATEPEEITVTASGGGSGTILYQWEKSSDNTNWSEISSETASTYQPGIAVNSIYYRCKLTATCKTIYSDSHFIEVYNDIESGEITGTQTICMSSVPSIFNGTSATGCKGNYLYQWQQSTNNADWTNISGATSRNYQSLALTTKTYFRRKVTDNVCGSKYSNTIIVTVRDEVSFGNISSDQSICYGSTPGIINGTSATGGDGSYSYQWQKSTDESTWTNISEATSVNYQPPSLTTTTYYRRKTNNTCKNGYSNIIKISVNNDLIAGVISSNQSICYDDTPNQLTGTNPSEGYGTYHYQWQMSTNNSTWSNIPNATSTNYQPGTLTSTTYFRRKDTDDCRVKYTNVVTITVYNQFTAGTISSSQTICYNTQPEKIVGTEPTGGKGSYSYQWQKSTSTGTWNNISGETYRDLELRNLTETSVYRRKDEDQCNTTYTNTVTITVYGNLEAGTLTGEQTICYNTQPSIFNGTSATGGDGNYSYQWQKSSNTVNWTNINDQENTYYQSEELTTTTYFRRTISNTCGTSNSNIIEVVVLEELKPGTISSSQTICYNTQPEKIDGNEATGGSSTYTYQWECSTNNVNWNIIVNATSKFYQPGTLTSTTYLRRKVTDNCGVAYTNVVMISVDPDLQAGEITGEQTTCYNTQPTSFNGTSATGGSGEYIYQWQKSSDGNNWDDIYNATSTNYQPESLTESTYFRRVDSDNCNTKYSNSILVTVSSELLIGDVGSDQITCYGEMPSVLKLVSVSGGSGDYIYQWQKSTDGSNWTNINGANSINYQPENLSNDYYFKIIVRDLCIEKESNSILIDVYEQLNGGTIGSNQVILYNTTPENLTTSVQASGGDGNYSYQWQKSTDENIWTNISGATSDDYQPEALTQTTYFKRKSISNCGEAESNTVQISVTNDEIIIGTIESDQFICNGETPEELVSVDYDSSYEVQWQKSTDGNSWTDIVGATKVNYQPPKITSTTYYRKKVYTASNGEVYTDPVVITIGDEIDAGTIGDSQSACKNKSPEPISTIEHPNISEYTFIWESSINGASWYEIEDATEDYYVVPILEETTYYRKKVITKCGIDYSNEITITVNEQLTGGTIEDNQEIEYNTTPTVLKGTEASGGDGSYSYQWQKSINGVDWINIAAAHDINYQPEILTQTTRYRRVATSGSCGEAYSNIVVIMTISELVPGSIGNNQTICYNSIPDNILGTEASGGIDIYSYYWESSADGINWIELFGKNDQKLESTGALTENTYFRRKVVSGESEAYSNIVSISLLDPVETPTVTDEDSYCYEEEVEIKSNMDNILWYDNSKSLISTDNTLRFIADQTTIYYYQIENSIGCLGDLKQMNIIVDRVDVDIQTSAFNNESIENGNKVVFDPNIETDLDESTLSYEWTLIHADKGWYESMNEQKPAQYLHWEGWHNIILQIKTNSGCLYTTVNENFLYVNAETPLYGESKSGVGRIELSEDFGTESPLTIEVYPIPLVNDLTLEVSHAKEEELVVSIINIVGQTVYNTLINGGEDTKELTLNLSTLQKGMYILLIQDGKQTYKKRIIKK